MINLDIYTREDIKDRLGVVIDSNYYLQQNQFLEQIKNNKKLNKNINDDLRENIEIETKKIVSVLKEKLGKDTKESQNIETILLTLGEKRNVLKDDISILGEKEAYNKFFIDKFNLIESFVSSYLKNSVLKIINKRDIEEPYIPIYEKNGSVFNTIKDIINGCTKNTSLLKGETHTYKCNKSIDSDLFSNENSSLVIHYIVLYMITIIINTQTQIETETFNEIATSATDEESDLTRDIMKQSEIESNVIHDILLFFSKNTKILDKHTSTYIKEIIETQSETNKESNLKFISELGEDSWASLKIKINLGLDDWKSLSSKDRSLYIPEPDRNSDNILDVEDIEKNKTIKARNVLGDIATDETISGFVEQDNIMDDELRELNDELMNVEGEDD